MATLFKKQFTKPIPDGAQIVTRKVKGQTKQFAQWTDLRGKCRTAELTDSGNRINVEATTWTAKYSDGEGHVREVATGCRDKDAAAAALADLKNVHCFLSWPSILPKQNGLRRPIPSS